MEQPYRIRPLGDCAVIVEWGGIISEEIHREVHAAARRIEDQPFDGLVECIPSYTTLSVHYDPVKVRKPEQYLTAGAYVRDLLEEFVRQPVASLEEKSTVVDIPVCYGGKYGPDLEDVAALNDLTAAEVIRLHSEGPYLVYALGFAPGFPYIGGMEERISAPRKKTPRLKIPAGSVGIAGNQTGIYPIETPGGWQIIGRTPLSLFQPEKDPPTLLKGGCRIRFRPVTEEEYSELEGNVL